MARSTTGGGFFSSAVRLAIVFLALIFLSPGVVHAVVVDATWVYDRTPANDDLARFTILDTLYIRSSSRPARWRSQSCHTLPLRPPFRSRLRWC